MFYQTIKGRWSKDKTHLNKSGKIYTAKGFIKIPYEVNVSHSQTDKLGILYRENLYNNERKLKCNYEDWKIIEYNLTEINK